MNSIFKFEFKAEFAGSTLPANPVGGQNSFAKRVSGAMPLAAAAYG
jgi:hypothetical protein